MMDRPKDVQGVRWLHISDFHIKDDNSYDRDVVLKALVSSASSLASRFGKPDLIFASGDIAFSGRRGEYDRASAFFDALLASLDLGRQRLLVVPGNHDIDRTRGKGLARTLTTRQDIDDYFSSSERPVHLDQRLHAFRTWFDEYFCNIRTFPSTSTCASPELFQINDVSLAVLLINSAGFSFDEHDHGQLLIGRPCLDRQLAEAASSVPNLTIAVMHHPLSWLSQIEATNIRTSLRQAADVILSGHLHENDAEHVVTASDGVLLLSAGAAYQTRDRPNTAMFCHYQATAVSVAPIVYSDSPREAWIPDTSLFPDAGDFVGVIDLNRSEPPVVARGDSGAPHADPFPIGANDLVQVADTGRVQSAKLEFEQDLFLSPSEMVLYAEPRLMDRAPEFAAEATGVAEPVSVASIVEATGSFLIETRPEYGGSTLCRRLAYELSVRGAPNYRRDARNMPSYRSKLEAEFPEEARRENGSATLILDHFDFERDERMLKEIERTTWFSRLIVITVNRGFMTAKAIDIETLSFLPRRLYLWPMSRENVREISSALFLSSDEAFVSTIVDKVYGDLLGLCIPLTPSNVIMYLRILHKEGDFHPLNRVDIVGRYIFETLRKPSDVYVETFSAKNKADVLSAFVYSLYCDNKSQFDDRRWFEFCSGHQNATLADFDAKRLLDELIEARVLARFGSQLYLKYSFFFSYFLGRHIASRVELRNKFIAEEEYLRLPEVVDVITGLSSDNTDVLLQLTTKLNEHLSNFAEKYVRREFDPLLKAVWPDSDREEEAVWKPVQEAIAAGPRSPKEIDDLKTSMLAEARTADQEVRFEKFSQLEHALFAVDVILSDALKNADDVTGELKLAALEGLLGSSLVAFQVGTMFAPTLANRSRFRWGGVQFVNFNVFGDDVDPQSREAFVNVIDGLCQAIPLRIGEDIGTYRLGGVFRERAKQVEAVGFLDVVLFYCVLSAKGLGWFDTLQMLIEKAERDSYYLCAMLDALMANLRREIGRARDRDEVKRLVALIQAKRSYNKKSPGSKLVNKMLKHLEKIDHFSKAKGDDL